jgi:hypothetical protein
VMMYTMYTTTTAQLIQCMIGGLVR